MPAVVIFGCRGCADFFFFLPLSVLLWLVTSAKNMKASSVTWEPCLLVDSSQCRQMKGRKWLLLHGLLNVYSSWTHHRLCWKCNMFALYFKINGYFTVLIKIKFLFSFLKFYFEVISNLYVLFIHIHQL